MATGYIKLYRQIWDNKLWLSEPFTRSQAWVDMLLMANHKPSIIFIRGNQVDLGIGQLAWSMKSLAERWRWSQEKVKRYLEMLVTERQIGMRVLTTTTVITILNYEKYNTNREQNPEQAVSKPRTNHEQTVTNNNDKNDDHEKNLCTEAQKIAFAKFEDWIRNHAPNVAKMKEPFTIQQYLKLSGNKDDKGNPIKGPTPEAVRDMLKRMHNHADLNRKNVSAYYTMLNWFRMEKGRA